MLKEFSEKEDELLEDIRNYQKAYPNGKKELGRYAKILFDEMMYK